MPRKKKVEEVAPENAGQVQIAEDIAGVEKQIEEYQSKIADLNEDVKTIEDKIQDLIDDINGKKARVQDIRNKQNDFVTAILQLQGVKFAYEKAAAEAAK